MMERQTTLLRKAFTKCESRTADDRSQGTDDTWCIKELATAGVRRWRSTGRSNDLFGWRDSARLPLSARVLLELRNNLTGDMPKASDQFPLSIR